MLRYGVEATSILGERNTYYILTLLRFEDLKTLVLDQRARK